VSSAAGGLDVIDISDPAAPVLLTTPSLASDTTDARIAAPYAFVTNGLAPLTPAPIGTLTSLDLYVPLDDRIGGGVGTDIAVQVGPAKLKLAEIASGALVVPSVNYTVEDDFGSNGGTMQFPGGTGDGPLITGARDDYKSLLNFGDRPAIISFWVDGDTSLANGGTIVSGGPNGYRSLGSGGWSAYTGNGNGKVWFVVARHNSPSGADCNVFSIAGSMVPVTDGRRHHIVIVYDPPHEMLYLYTDGVKGGIRNLAGCRADSEGDDAGTAPGRDHDWFTIGEAGEIYNGRQFYNGSVEDLYIFTPPAVPDDIDAIVSEWYTLGMPGARATGKL
jgi:hypothetical protein